MKPGTGTLDDPERRKSFPVATGVVDYFPDALVAIAELSRVGNDKHNPGEPLHWARGKGGNNADELMRHFIQRGTVDAEDGVRHSTKVAWRALALLQLEIEAAQECAARELPDMADNRCVLCGDNVPPGELCGCTHVTRFIIGR